MVGGKKKPKIIVTIPAYNEEKTIAAVISGIRRAMSNYNYAIQIIDDGSTDKTVQIARKAGAKVISHPKNYGLATAFNTELEEALKTNADIIIHIDADGQYLPEEIPLLVEGIENGADLVLGSRSAPFSIHSTSKGISSGKYCPS